MGLCLTELNFTLSIDLHSTSGQHERACACHQALPQTPWDMLRPPDRCGRLWPPSWSLWPSMAQRHGWLPPLKAAAQSAHRITVDAAGTSHRPIWIWIWIVFALLRCSSCIIILTCERRPKQGTTTRRNISTTVQTEERVYIVDSYI